MDLGPQTSISVSGRKAGAKNIRPWMWSRWRWVSRRLMCGTFPARVSPRLRIPVPASSTITVPSDSVTWTHDVLPP